MSIIQQLSNKNTWLEFLSYKQELGLLSRRDEKELIQFIENNEYLDAFQRIMSSGFSIPRKCIINKAHSKKKRVVYIFPRTENYILKLMTFLLIRRYDSAFADNLYSFRTHHGVRYAVQLLKSMTNLASKYVYKTDISNYFNSVCIERLLPILKSVMEDDTDTYNLIASMLTDTRVLLSDGSIINEHKGIMAGVPISSFLANLYLKDLDWYFQKQNISYIRYSDDIIIIASTTKERSEAVIYLRDYLQEAQLEMNETKELLTEPHGKWNFLGVSYENGIFDVSDTSARKLKQKMRRKSRALLRWKTRKNIDNIKAARVFIKVFNHKLYDNKYKSELTWARWFFPLINTSQSLKIIDRYMQECLRFIVTEKRNKGRYRFHYDDMKKLGYRSLVHEYYSIHKQAKNKNERY